MSEKDCKSEPFFSIIIPMYNVGNLVTGCLQSVYMQDIAEDDIEVFVVDDCSSDNSHEYLNAFARKHDNMIIVRHRENKRPGGARNTALHMSRGKYIMFLDADDYWKYTNTLSILKSIIDSSGADVVDNNVHENVNYDSTPSPQSYCGQVDYQYIGGGIY